MKVLLLFIFTFICSGQAYTQLVYRNGNISTGKIANNGTTAPGNYSWSEVQNNTGNTTETNMALGFPCYRSDSLGFLFSLADNFTIPISEEWNISNIAVYTYQFDNTEINSLVQNVRLQIWNGRPDSAGSSIVFGDLETNRFSSAIDSLTYRIANTSFFENAADTKRKIWKLNSTVNTTLSAGKYWVEWQTAATNDLPHFSPAVTIKGKRESPNDAALIHDANTGKWFTALDAGGVDSSSASNNSQDLPFDISYNLKSSAGNSNIWIAPTVLRDNLIIYFLNNNETKTNIRIIDAQGRVIITLLNTAISQGTSTIEIPVSSLAKGVYFLNIVTGSNTKTLKFIKQ